MAIPTFLAVVRLICIAAWLFGVQVAADFTIVYDDSRVSYNPNWGDTITSKDVSSCSYKLGIAQESLRISFKGSKITLLGERFVESIGTDSWVKLVVKIDGGNEQQYTSHWSTDTCSHVYFYSSELAFGDHVLEATVDSFNDSGFRFNRAQVEEHGAPASTMSSSTSSSSPSSSSSSTLSTSRSTISPVLTRSSSSSSSSAPATTSSSATSSGASAPTGLAIPGAPDFATHTTLPGGAIGGIVAGVVVLLIAVVFLFFFASRRRKRSKPIKTVDLMSGGYEKQDPEAVPPPEALVISPYHHPGPALPGIPSMNGNSLYNGITPTSASPVSESPPSSYPAPPSNVARTMSFGSVTSSSTRMSTSTAPLAYPRDSKVMIGESTPHSGGLSITVPPLTSAAGPSNAAPGAGISHEQAELIGNLAEMGMPAPQLARVVRSMSGNAVEMHDGITESSLPPPSYEAARNN